jgi:hypothetical protein
MRYALILCLLPTLALAETPLTGAEFEAMVGNRTLTYAYDGMPFGTEEYYPNRRVGWAFTDDVCVYGEWYEKGDAICFTYSNDPTPQCWRFYAEGGQLTARFLDRGIEGPVATASEAEEPLFCPGPDVGV